jgi:hypothetical protein
VQNDQAVQNNQPVQAKNQEAVDITNEDLGYPAKIDQGQPQTTPNIPSFSEEIVPLQANVVSEKPTINQNAQNIETQSSNIDLKQKTINNNPSPVEL